MMNFNQGDVVMIQARPKPYKAKVEWVDRSFSGDPVKARVRPIYSDDVNGRARNVYAKHVIEILDNNHKRP